VCQNEDEKVVLDYLAELQEVMFLSPPDHKKDRAFVQMLYQFKRDLTR